MAESSIYQSISKRTGGDVYVGVVGPVRTGKSTFISRFLETVVLPNVENEYDKARAVDETPQSGSGKTITTTEPKFVPDEAVRVSIGGTSCNVKLVDCVGFMVEGAAGDEEDGEERMVSTPWAKEAIPFSEAAAIGTRRVIAEHSTIAVLVTTDGSFTDIPRENYAEAERRVVEELKASGKPFVIVLNSAHPSFEETLSLAESLEEGYGVPVALVSCKELDAEDFSEIFSLVLGEFPATEFTFTLPEWCAALGEDHPLMRSLSEKIAAFSERVTKLGDVPAALGAVEGIAQISLDAGDGTGRFTLPLGKEVYYETMAKESGLDVSDDASLFRTVVELSKVKREYDRVAEALADVRTKGYGVVMPTADEVELLEPTLTKQAGGQGVRVSARAETIHMIRAGIRADFCPVVGSEEQAVEVVKYLTDGQEEDPKKVFESNLFGRSLYDLIRDGMDQKIRLVSDESREKLGETLERIVNEGSNGLICILL